MEKYIIKNFELWNLKDYEHRSTNGENEDSQNNCNGGHSVDGAFEDNRELLICNDADFVESSHVYGNQDLFP